MIKRLTLISISILLSGCDIPRNKYPFHIVNVSYEDPVYHDVKGYCDDDNEQEATIDEMFGFPFSNGNAPKGVSMHDLGASGFNVFCALRIDFYQDQAHQCYLFSYDNEELKNMKVSTGLSLPSSNVIFVIKKDGLEAMTRKDYERLKLTFKPHPFDPTLCKPRPSI